MNYRPRWIQHPNEQRAAPRAEMQRPGVLHGENGPTAVTIRDLSADGVGFDLPPHKAGAAFDKTAQIEIPGLARLPVALCWQGRLKLGAAFAVPEARKQALKLQIERIATRSR